MSSKQLILFKGLDAKKLDTCLFELSCLIGDLKYLALVIEISKGRIGAFNTTLETAGVVADLGAELSDLSLKYIDWTPDRWKVLCHYEPYYPALEPRSYPSLYETATGFKGSASATLLRLRACLESGSIKVPRELAEVRGGFEEILKKLK